MADSPAIDWLLASDPAIRWQVLRDLLDAPEPHWRAERAKVQTQGWGPGSCRTRTPTGSAPAAPSCRRGSPGSEWEQVGQPWTATTHVLTQLREFGLDPAADRVRRSIELIAALARCRRRGQGRPVWGSAIGTLAVESGSLQSKLEWRRSRSAWGSRSTRRKSGGYGWVAS